VSEDVPQPMRLAAGSRIGGYLLEEQIGQGGMAVVFRALDERLGRQVALKILSPALAADSAFRQRFIRESRAAAGVDDPHIIPVFEAGEADGALFIAMRYVRGGDVRSLVSRDGGLPGARVAGIVSPLASALDAAHAAGLVHRDVKPANMLLDARLGRPDHVYLSDFGLSKEALGSVGLTVSGQFLGTVDYVAPEQIEGRVVDGRADQYALGCAAFEMLCGEPPFSRDQPMAVLYAHMSEPSPRVTSRRPGLPGALDSVFARVLAKSPDDRYGSCRMFSDALRASLAIAPYAVDAQLRRADTEVAGTGHAAAAQAGGIAGATTSAAAVPAGSGMPTVPPRAERPDPLRWPERDHPMESKQGARRWPIAATAIAAVVAVAISLAALKGHTSGTSASPGTSPVTTGSPNASPAGRAHKTSPSASLSPGGAGAPQGQPGGPENTWIAQLASVSITDGTARLDEVLARIRLDIPRAKVLNSFDYASLRPGYWVIYYAGSFTTGTQALAYCAAHGRTTSNQCIGRYLSHNPADYYYRCYPPATNSSAACFRP
jgi:Protein kinase domain